VPISPFFLFWGRYALTEQEFSVSGFKRRYQEPRSDKGKKNN
jgi:hypothetical protein